MNLTNFVPAEFLGPDYNIYQFTDGIYKIVRFKSTAPRLYNLDREKFEHYDTKIQASLSRARRSVLELALCNDWEYFCTFTIAETNFDRKDLAGWYKSFSQWILDQRKKYKKIGIDVSLKYLLVPEQHKDGSWHMHGLFMGIFPLLISFYHLDKAGWNIPYDLVDDGYYCWFDYWMKYGFCSLAKIENKVACAFYVSKYISKSINDSAITVGKDLYYRSQGLLKPDLHGQVYGRTEYLDQFITHHYDFCSTGFTHLKDGLDWSFALDFMDFELLQSYSVPDPEDALCSADSFYQYTQLRYDRYGGIYEEEFT